MVWSIHVHVGKLIQSNGLSKTSLIKQSKILFQKRRYAGYQKSLVLTASRRYTKNLN